MINEVAAHRTQRYTSGTGDRGGTRRAVQSCAKTGPSAVLPPTGRTGEVALRRLPGNGTPPTHPLVSHVVTSMCLVQRPVAAFHLVG